MCDHGLQATCLFSKHVLEFKIYWMETKNNSVILANCFESFISNIQLKYAQEKKQMYWLQILN